MRGAILTALACACLPASALARTQDVWVNDPAGVPQAQILRVERAVLRQANGRFRKVWHTPRIRFTASKGWMISLVPIDTLAGCDCLGLHDVEAGQPYALVGIGQAHVRKRSRGVTVLAAVPREPWSVAFSHEILEMLAGREVCDPLTGSYRVGGVRVARYVTPRWFVRASPR